MWHNLSLLILYSSSGATSKNLKTLLMSIIVLVNKMVYNTCGVMLINYHQNWQHVIHSDSIIIQSYTIIPTNTVNDRYVTYSLKIKEQ